MNENKNDSEERQDEVVEPAKRKKRKKSQEKAKRRISSNDAHLLRIVPPLKLKKVAAMNYFNSNVDNDSHQSQSEQMVDYRIVTGATPAIVNKDMPSLDNDLNSNFNKT